MLAIICVCDQVVTSFPAYVTNCKLYLTLEMQLQRHCPIMVATFPELSTVKTCH